MPGNKYEYENERGRERRELGHGMERSVDAGNTQRLRLAVRPVRCVLRVDAALRHGVEVNMPVLGMSTVSFVTSSSCDIGRVRPLNPTSEGYATPRSRRPKVLQRPAAPAFAPMQAEVRRHGRPRVRRCFRTWPDARWPRPSMGGGRRARAIAPARAGRW